MTSAGGLPDLTVVPFALTPALVSGAMLAHPHRIALDVSTDTLIAYCIDRRVTLDEAELRLRAVEQMEARVAGLILTEREPLRWVEPVGEGSRPARAKILAEVERLCGEGASASSAEARVHASFLALMFYADAPSDVAHINGAWWATPLGQLCDRVLHVA